MEYLERNPTLWFEGKSEHYQFSAATYNFNVKQPAFLKKMAVTSNSLKFEREVNTFREARNTHENIVRFFNAAYVQTESSRLIIIELCICSLADLYEPERKRAWIDHQKQFVEQQIPVAFDAKKAPNQILDEICSWMENAVNKKSVLRQATEAVAFLHSLSIIHRNLKPSNFLITKVNDEYVIKLTDMHFSKNIKQEPNNSKPELEWLAPESLNDELTLKIDVFVLGCVFYYVFSKGKHPFDLGKEKPTRSDRESNILDYKHVAIAKWPEILGEDAPCDLIGKMISEDPDVRSTAEDLLRDDYFTLEGEYALSGKIDYTRNGTDVDCEKLKETFANLGFDVNIRDDVDGEVLVSDMEKIGQEWNEQYKSLVVCILSHGQKDKVLGADSTPVDINRLKYALNSTDSPKLNGLPKVFIIQACQGYLIAHEAASASLGKVQKASVASRLSDVFQRLFIRSTDKTGSPQKNRKKKFLLYPPVLDVLSMMSSVPEFASFRNEEYGSYFIQQLCNQIDARPPESTLESIFQAIVKAVYDKDIHVMVEDCDIRYMGDFEAYEAGAELFIKVKQVPEMRSSLRKRFRLLDGQQRGRVSVVKDDGEHIALDASYVDWKQSLRSSDSPDS